LSPILTDELNEKIPSVSRSFALLSCKMKISSTGRAHIIFGQVGGRIVTPAMENLIKRLDLRLEQNPGLK
jgi:hypothetical protein